MRYSWIKLLLGSVMLLTLWGGITWAETLFVQRTKVEIKQGQGAFYPTVYTAKQGEGLEVLGEQGGWYQVKTPSGSGWVFGQALDKKKPGTTLTSMLGSADTTDLDKTAGYKGFDAPTEGAYVKANNLQAQMRLVDGLQRPVFSIVELENFQKVGRLGRYGGAK